MDVLRRHFEPLLYEQSYVAARLVTHARDGDCDAFDALMREHEPRLRAFLQARVGREAVEDVLQETRIAAYLALPKFHGRSRFKVWLFGVAHHKCADHHRQRRRHAARWKRPSTRQGVDPVDPTDRYGAIDLKWSVRQMLESLPDVQREVVELYYFGDITLAEIAALLGRSVNTVKAQFYRAHTAAAATAALTDSTTADREASGKSVAGEGKR